MVAPSRSWYNTQPSTRPTSPTPARCARPTTSVRHSGYGRAPKVGGSAMGKKDGCFSFRSCPCMASCIGSSLCLWSVSSWLSFPFPFSCCFSRYTSEGEEGDTGLAMGVLAGVETGCDKMAEMKVEDMGWGKWRWRIRRMLVYAICSKGQFEEGLKRTAQRDNLTG